MLEKTYEISFTATFVAKSTDDVFNIIKSIQTSEIVREADEYNINANIIISQNIQGDPTL
jgi:hypothetical protein